MAAISFLPANQPADMKLNQFRSVMGYSSTCSGAAVIESRLFVAMQKPRYDRALIKPQSDGISTIKQTMALDYVKTKFEDKTKQVSHGLFDVTNIKRQAVEDFTGFINSMTSNDMFKQLTLTVKSSGTRLKNKEKFYMHTFQRMMLHDTVRALISRCELNEYTQLLLSFLKCNLGIQNLSPQRIGELVNRFTPKASGYIIPRRCGKSSFSTALMALAMVLCPAAGLRILYTAQMKQLCSDAFTTLKTNVQKLIAHFNKEKLNEFMARVKYVQSQNPNVTNHGQTYFQAAVKWSESEQTITVYFYQFKDAPAIIRANTPTISTNQFRAKPYICANAHRGATYNLMFIDETNFIKPSIFPEVLSQLANGSAAKMICTSSQKNGQDSRPFVNLRDTRMNKIVTNVVEFVCPNHCLSLIREEEVQYTMCLCNTFQQPHHINTGSDMQKLMKAFSVVVSSAEEGGDVTNNRSAMLSEIGVMPPDITKDDLNGLGDNISKMRLTVDCGRKNFMNNKIDVEAEISAGKISKTVVAYLDPTPTSYKSENLETFDRSLHAISFVTKMKNGKVVVLGLEEFTTQQYEPESHDAMKAIANVFMAQVFALNTLYHGHFSEFILIPEINSFDLDNMWYNCGIIFTQHQELLKDVCVMVPAIVVDQHQQKFLQSRVKRKYKRIVLNNGRVILTDTGREMMMEDEGEYDKLEETRVQSYLSDNLRAVALTREEFEDRMSHDSQLKYKIGYRMGNEKVNMFLNFFSRTFYNSFHMATTVVSLSNSGKHVLDAYLLEKLDNLVITTSISRGSGKKVYHVSGKRVSGKNKHVADDLPVCVVMSSQLFDQYSNFKQSESEIMLKLTPVAAIN